MSKWAGKTSDSGWSFLFSLILPPPSGPRAQHRLPSGTSSHALEIRGDQTGPPLGDCPRTCPAGVDAQAPPSRCLQTGRRFPFSESRRRFPGRRSQGAGGGLFIRARASLPGSHAALAPVRLLPGLPPSALGWLVCAGSRLSRPGSGQLANPHSTVSCRGRRREGRGEHHRGRGRAVPGPDAHGESVEKPSPDPGDPGHCPILRRDSLVPLLKLLLDKM